MMEESERYQRGRSYFASLILDDGQTQVRTVKWLIIFFAVALSSALLNSIWVSGINLYPELVTSLVVLFGLYHFVSRDTTNIATGILVWTMAILSFTLAWQNQGLYDTAIMVFPCLLAIAAMMGGKLLLYSLLSFLLLSLYFFAFALETGFLERKPPEISHLWGKANNIVLLLVFYVFCINILLAYAAKIIKTLKAENRAYFRMNEEAENQVLYDRLTQLPNEVLCGRDLASLFSGNIKRDQMLGFISLSLDNMELINSSLGHDTGDSAIIYQASQLKRFLDKKVRVYRSSGNEFILTVLTSDYQELQDFTYQVMQAVNRPFQVESYDIEVPCSLGIAVYPTDGEDFPDLMRRSNLALTRARDDEQQVFRFFEDEMEQEARQRLQMIQHLKSAVKNRELEVYYQPKISLESNQIVGAEALLRWNRGEQGMVSPAEFIPVAETSGQMGEIGAWVIEQACNDCKSWHDLGLGGLKIAVNLSPQQFRRGDLPNIVFRALSDSGLSPTWLDLEITESLIIDDSQHVSQQISQFVDKGIRIAIDDFGTGYSNLNYLTKFRASELKIDMSFVRDMLHIENKKHIVHAIIKMSAEMGLCNVAEGVEDAQTVELLKSFDCQFAQGYHWSKPLPYKDFVEFVKTHSSP